MAPRLLKLPQVADRCGLRTTSIYDQAKAGLFPKPIKLTPRSSAWVESEVDAVIRARIAGQSDGEIRKLVSKLAAARAQQAA
jgi:prophage regulatory protein